MRLLGSTFSRFNHALNIMGSAHDSRLWGYPYPSPTYTYGYDRPAKLCMITKLGEVKVLWTSPHSSNSKGCVLHPKLDGGHSFGFVQPSVGVICSPKYLKFVVWKLILRGNFTCWRPVFTPKSFYYACPLPPRGCPALVMVICLFSKFCRFSDCNTS